MSTQKIIKGSKQFLHFGIQQALCCIFPVALFAALALSKVVHIPYLPRYDFVLLACILVQFLMVRYKLESIDELKVISLFHLIGLALEIFKVHMGSWAYPEAAYTKILDVPLYSGFMYASVASYICQAWRRFDLKFTRWPVNLFTYPLAAAIYLNFFTHHVLPDFRWVIIGALFLVFWKGYVEFTVNRERYRMPTLLSFMLVGFFIYVAENLSTFLGAWKYPNQMAGWQLVHAGKISSWFLLVIISIIIVANLKHIKYARSDNETGKVSAL